MQYAMFDHGLGQCDYTSVGVEIYITELRRVGEVQNITSRGQPRQSETCS